MYILKYRSTLKRPTPIHSNLITKEYTPPNVKVHCKSILDQQWKQIIHITPSTYLVNDYLPLTHVYQTLPWQIGYQHAYAANKTHIIIKINPSITSKHSAENITVKQRNFITQYTQWSSKIPWPLHQVNSLTEELLRL